MKRPMPLSQPRPDCFVDPIIWTSRLLVVGLALTASSLAGCSDDGSSAESSGGPGAGSSDGPTASAEDEWRRRPAKPVDGGAGDTGTSSPAPELVQPACGGASTSSSTGPASKNYTIERKTSRTVDVLGAGQAGAVSFEFQSYPCYSVYAAQHYATWRVRDAAGGDYTFQWNVIQSFQNLTLPVTISAAGVTDDDYYPQGICAAAAIVRNIDYTTVGTTCLDVPVVRAKFSAGTWSAPLATIGANVAPGTVLSFSARARFFANYSAPSCARVYLSGRSGGVTLSPSTPQTAGLVQLEAPVLVSALPTCLSSPLSPQEDPLADFSLELSKVAQGATQ